MNNLLYFIDILKLKCLNKDNNHIIIRENLHGTQETILENEKTDNNISSSTFTYNQSLNKSNFYLTIDLGTYYTKKFIIIKKK